MLPSKFSIRSMMIAVTLASIVLAVVAQAVRGQGWAIAASMSVAAIFAIFVSHVVFFLFAMGLSWLASRRSTREPGAGSPFAQHRPPPQWIEPSEPES